MVERNLDTENPPEPPAWRQGGFWIRRRHEALWESILSAPAALSFDEGEIALHKEGRHNAANEECGRLHD